MLKNASLQFNEAEERIMLSGENLQLITKVQTFQKLNGGREPFRPQKSKCDIDFNFFTCAF